MYAFGILNSCGHFPSPELHAHLLQALRESALAVRVAHNPSRCCYLEDCSCARCMRSPWWQPKKEVEEKGARARGGVGKVRKGKKRKDRALAIPSRVTAGMDIPEKCTAHARQDPVSLANASTKPAGRCKRCRRPSHAVPQPFRAPSLL